MVKSIINNITLYSFICTATAVYSSVCLGQSLPKIEHHTQNGGYEVLYKLAPRTYPNSGNTQNIAPGSKEPLKISQIGISYERSAEITSLMAGYLKIKLDELKLKSESEIVDFLGNFCLPQEEPSECRERYFVLQTPLLYRLQNALVKADDAQAKLACPSRDSDGNCTVGSTFNLQVADTSLPETNYLPYLPSFKDLQNYAKDRQLVTKMTQSSYNDWIKDQFAKRDKDDWYSHNVQAEPIKEQFLLTKSVPRDPNDPDSSMTTVFVTDAKGNPVPDSQAFELAHRQWENDKRAIFDKAGYKDTMSNVRRSDSQWREMGDINHISSDSEEAYLYNAVRAPFVNEANHMAADAAQKQKKPATKGKVSKQSETGQSTAKTASSSKNKKVDQASLGPYQGDGNEQVNPPKNLNNAHHSISFKPEIFSVQKVIEFRQPTQPAPAENSSDPSEGL